MCLIIGIGLFGPRIAAVVWWLADSARWTLAFGENFLVPALGILFLPWLTVVYVLTHQRASPAWTCSGSSLPRSRTSVRTLVAGSAAGGSSGSPATRTASKGLNGGSGRGLHSGLVKEIRCPTSM